MSHSYDPGPAFEYASEEVGEAFTEWCVSEEIEARDDQEYRTVRAAFAAGMNEVSRYGQVGFRAVLAIHQPVKGDLDTPAKCGHCLDAYGQLVAWPCATYAAIRRELTGEETRSA